MSYLTALESSWRKNKMRPEKELRRPKSLRGRDVVYELERLFVMTKDPRFEAAICALFHHRAIDEKLNFTRWRPPSYEKLDVKKNAMMAAFISKLVSDGKSLRRACAECAAFTGHQASSFNAAVKDLEKLYSKLRKSA
jgi:hypothetical protein